MARRTKAEALQTRHKLLDAAETVALRASAATLAAAIDDGLQALGSTPHLPGAD